VSAWSAAAAAVVVVALNRHLPELSPHQVQLQLLEHHFLLVTVGQTPKTTPSMLLLGMAAQVDQPQ